MLQEYAATGWLRLPIPATMALMAEWYNNYYFGEEAETALFNSDMVLCFLNAAEGRTKLPLQLIDQNIRIDYNKLRHLMAVDRRLDVSLPTRLNGNFSLLKAIIAEGETTSPINPSFLLEQLLNPENFISLLYYFGLLSIAGAENEETRLQIPNRTVKELMCSYIRDAFANVDVFKVDPALLRSRNRWR